MEKLGRAVHAFLAADRRNGEEAERLRLAAALLDRHGVERAIDAREVVAASTRLWRWIDSAFAPHRGFREWPVTDTLASGTLVTGIADLVLHTPPGFILIDHKSFPGTLQDALGRAAQHSGQVAAYAQAIEKAASQPVLSTWIHLPLLGAVVALHLETSMDGVRAPTRVA